jgi:multicomponent Na+:H+ antiporter subunit G
MSAPAQTLQALSGHLSLLLLGAGLLLWFWGTWPLLEGGSYLGRLHKLSVSDTLGSALMLLGLLLRIPGQWPLLGLALLGLIVWNTIFGYVLASCSLPQPSEQPHRADRSR